MKGLLSLITVALMSVGSMNAWAQVPPKLIEMNFFNVSGQSIDCSGGGYVAVELTFDKPMKNTVSPTVRYGRNGAYNLNLPLNGRWENSTLYQGSFNVSPSVPSEVDGEYFFLVFNAQDTAGTAMDSTYSDSLNTSLLIYRNGQVTANSDSLGFGIIPAGRTRDRSVTLTNGGCTDVTINSVTLTNGTNFSVLDNVNNATIQRDSSLAINVRFSPLLRQTYSGNLRVIFTTNARRDTLNVLLGGRARGPKIAFVPAGTINFGTISAGGSFTQTVQVINQAAAEADLSDTLSITNILSSLPTIFEIGQKLLPLVIAPDDTQSITITFKPVAAQTYNGNAGFTTNDLIWPNGAVSIALTGIGNILQPPPPIPRLNVTWAGGYAGYTNANALTICVPLDTAGIAQVRWKFSQLPAPPTSPSDTADVDVYGGGGSPQYSGPNSLCFTIPLAGRLPAGRWYCYIWLQGTNGASNFNNAFYSPFTYDNIPPSLTSLIVDGGYWPGGFVNFTSLTNIPICWTTDDVSGISEVRYKFVRNANPPSNAADTANGGTFSLTGSDTTLRCASLSLLGLANARGFFNCYVWLVDKSGNSGFRNALRTLIKYDTSSPAAPSAPVTRNIPATTWFGAPNNRVLTLTANTPNDASDAAWVRWKFKTPPTNTSVADGQALIARGDNNAFSFSVLFNSPTLCGDDTLYYWLADSSGNSDPTQNALARYRFDMCPPTITRVLSSNNNVALVGQAFRDRVLVRDPDSGVDTVWVRYRLGGANTEAPPIPAYRIGATDTFYFDIPIAGVTARGIEYRVTARDLIPNEGYGPSNNTTCYGGGYNDDDGYWYPIRTRVTGEGDFRIDTDGRPVPLISGPDSTSYQLFSVPYQADNPNAVNVLQDDLGAYDATQWRLFDYNPQNPLSTRWLEGNNARPFAPGRSYFLISRQANIVIDSGPATTRRTVCPDTLTLYPGWNLIATPFNFPVHKRSLSLQNATQDTVSLWSFERRWTFTDVMDPWRGYAVYVVRNPNVPANAPIRLIVQPVAVPGRIGKEVASAQPALQSGEWLVQISAIAGNAEDTHNWAGMRNGAEAGFDFLEMAEPPVIGGYVAVSFPHAEWEQPAENFCTDFRAASEEEQVWNFEVATNQKHTSVRLSFDFLGELPREAKVYLIDEALGMVQDLRAKPEYTFRSGSQNVQKSLKLIVGSQQFVTKQAGQLALVPEKFEVLQNFPNPFNPETSIRYNLSQAAPVSVVIFDQLGRVVRTLVNGETQEAGYHLTLWDGRDAAGRPVASGIYIYKVTAGSESLARKMVLQK